LGWWRRRSLIGWNKHGWRIVTLIRM